MTADGEKVAAEEAKVVETASTDAKMDEASASSKGEVQADSSAETALVVALRPPKAVEPCTAIELRKEPALDVTGDSKDIKPKAKKSRDKTGVLFTIGHPAAWDLNDLLKVLERYAVQSVLDARPTPEKGPTADSLRVACSSSAISYERQPLLSNVYCKLADQVTGTSSIDASTPCILLSGEFSWRLQQQRRCLQRAMNSKLLEVHHLEWTGDVDRAASALCEKQPKREDHKYPKAAAYVKPSKAAPKAAVLQSKPKGGGAAPTADAAPPSFGMPGGVLPSKPKASGLSPAGAAAAAAEATAAAASVLPSRPKGAPKQPAVVEDTSDMAAQAEAEQTANMLRPKPKQGAAIPRPSPPRDSPPATLTPKPKESEKLLLKPVAPKVAAPTPKPAPKTDSENMWDLLKNKSEPKAEQKVTPKLAASLKPSATPEPPVMRASAKGAPSAPKEAAAEEPKVMKASAKGAPAKQAAPVLRASAKGAPTSSATKRDNADLWDLLDGPPKKGKTDESL